MISRVTASDPSMLKCLIEYELFKLNSQVEEFSICESLVKHLFDGQFESIFQYDIVKDIFPSYSCEDMDIPEKLAKDLVLNVESYLEASSSNSLHHRSFIVLCIGISCLLLFHQNNWTGPSTKFDPINLFMKNSLEQEQISNINDQIVEALYVEAEPCYQLASKISFLLLADTFLITCSKKLTSLQICEWWKIRCLYTRQIMLEERSPIIKESIMESFDRISEKEPFKSFMGDEYSTELTDGDRQHLDMVILFILEIGYIMHYYFERKQSELYFTKAKHLSSIEIELTGALGKRTRFQEKNLAQLVIKVKRTKENDGSHDSIDRDCLPKNINLDDDTVYNDIKLIEDSQDFTTEVSAMEQSILLALCPQHRKLHESINNIVKEEALAHLTYIISQPKSWCILSSALLQRTFWDKDSPRRIERSLNQIEELVNQFENPCANPSVRSEYLISSKMPPRWLMQKEYGLFLVDIGDLNAALEIFMRIHMWDDVIICLQRLGRHEKAEKVIREQLDIKETPTLWCHLGDATLDISYFEKAWELSNHRYSRAQRSMALWYLKRGKFEDSLDHFKKCLTINPIQIGIWYSYGCAALACEKYEIAATAFHRCVNLEYDNFEAWNNLATAYIRSGQKTRAFLMLKESLKCSYDDWRVWENYAVVGTDIGEFGEVIRAYHRLLDIKDKYVDKEVLPILVKAVNENIKDAKGNPTCELRSKLMELFGRISSKITNEVVVWKCYSDLILNSSMDVTQTDIERGIQYRIKSLRCITQKANWEREVADCIEVISFCNHFAKECICNVQKIEQNSQRIQFLSSAKLMLNGACSKAKLKHTDPVSKEVIIGELRSVLVDLDNNILEIIQILNDNKN